MAMFVARELHISPIEILNTWYPDQLIIAWGYYINLRQSKYFNSLEPNKRQAQKDYIVYFMDSYKYEIKQKIEAQFNGDS
jgi:hypothetical protein